MAHEPAPLHTRSCVALGALNSYSVDLHLLACVAQLRSDVALPAAFWYSPLSQTSHLVQLVRRCSLLVWNVPLAHAEHVRFAVSPPLPDAGWVCTLPSQLDPYPLPWLLQPESFALMRHCFRAALYV